MRTRALDFINECASLTPGEVASWSDEELGTWLSQWGNYVKNGGVRPGHPH